MLCWIHSLPSRYKKCCRHVGTIGGMVLLSLLTVHCGKRDEPPPPQVEPPQSLREQYKDASKATAENPGVAGSPGELKEERKSGE
jgi:hypothetical protein